MARTNELIVTDISDGGDAMADVDVDRLSNSYTLNILNEKEGFTIPLEFRGTQTILEIKTNVYTITNIAVRHQEWIGWPANVTNETMLGLSGIPREHNLTLRSTEAVAAVASGSRNAAAAAVAATEPETIDIDSDGTGEEFEDASDFNGEDDIFTSPVAQNRVKHLSECAMCSREMR